MAVQWLPGTLAPHPFPFKGGRHVFAAVYVSSNYKPPELMVEYANYIYLMTRWARADGRPVACAILAAFHRLPGRRVERRRQ